jgi:hypothetical protein
MILNWHSMFYAMTLALRSIENVHPYISRPRRLPMQHPSPLDTQLNRRKFVTLAGATALAPLSAGAQATFPSRPLTLLVPFTAGGPSDVGARVIATELARLLGQPVVLENLPGASGALAVQKLLRSTADGHTLLYGGMSESLLVPMINPALGYRSASAPAFPWCTFPTKAGRRSSRT